MSAAQVRAVRDLAAPIVEQLGCDLEDVTIRQAGSRRLVRVVVDHAEGLSLDLVAQLSRAVSRALDEAEPLGQSAYVLEVTSPGVDRPLREPRHWQRAVGRLVAVTPQAGERFTGRVRSADGSVAVLDVDGVDVTVRFADVSRAVVQVELKRIDDVELEELDGVDAEDDPATAGEE